MFHFFQQAQLQRIDSSDIIIAICFLAATALVVGIIKRLLGKRLSAWARRQVSTVDPYLKAKAVSSLYWLAILIVLHMGFRLLPIDKTIETYSGHVFLVLYTWTTISVLINTMSFSLDVVLRRRGKSLSEHRGKVLMPVLKGVAWMVALAFILENMGMEISTILAGLGVAGVAVGIAAQAVLGDLFSYFAILFDRPFRIGDFIVLTPEVRGHIEHIGLKTSRIRSLDGEQIILSNTDLTNSRVKNYRRMTRRRIMFAFGVLYSTPPDKLESLPGTIKSIIDDTPLATFDRAHFRGFGQSSLDFEVVYYVESPDYNEYMDTQQAINLALVRALHDGNMEFAFPTRTIHMEREEAPNA